MTDWLRTLLGRPAHPPRRPLGPPTGRCEPPWWRVLGFDAGPPRSLGHVERRFREMAAALHPDRGGDAVRMQSLNRARAEARRALRARP